MSFGKIQLQSQYMPDFSKIHASMETIYEEERRQLELREKAQNATLELNEQTKQQNEILKQQLVEVLAQKELLTKQLDEQKKINASIENESRKGSQEAKKARCIACWSLVVAVTSTFVTIIIAILK